MKLKTIPSVLALSALLAAPAFAQDTSASQYVPTEDELDVVRVALTKIGCTVETEDQAALVEEYTGYDAASLEAIVDLLRIYQEVVDATNDTGGITLVSGDCAV
ncbi:hypothetical protein [Actibacterium sp. XHP0104]|uniref:hypothetical protein n=1 Tax=Actibacterium sp. XHP0104 TaxID=2984335 RepID=UPI0021E99275|nr:hypothetical protein [Actibacterium sp. XHP0104]MCV2880686.1 hypothetical protein [Actibacterium sp. XHP0104]